MSVDPIEEQIISKMRGAGVAEPTIAGFVNAVRRVRSGERGMLPESAIDPIPALPRLESLDDSRVAGAELLGQLVVFKLNGGLGTGMGLDRAKSLLPVRDGSNFLDFIVRQILHLRRQTGTLVPAFCLMNSVITREDTLKHLAHYSELSGQGDLDFLQNIVPKIDPQTFAPAYWPADPELEWCPPGHGDFYPSLLASGLLDQLLAKGIRYAFVSNSDNLGATVDPKLLRYFADQDVPFLMEVADRTGADRKGGHLARSKASGRLLLRESAQCPKADDATFQDIARHRFFNTNNLWIRLDHVRRELDANGGSFPLPLITNQKTVDPRDASSPKVLQLESAMGAAIECFDRATAMVVPRSRFAPVKSTNDLLALRSDAYCVTEDHRLVLHPKRNAQPPLVDLDSTHYKVISDFEELFPNGSPFLLECESMKVEGRVRFAAGITCIGKVRFVQTGSNPAEVPSGTYRDTTVQL